MSEDTQEGTSEEENQDQESDTQEGTSEDSEEEQDQENTQHFIDESQEFSEFDSHSSGRIIAPVLEAQAIPISSLEQTTGFTPGSSATSDSSSDSLYNPGNQEKGFSQYEQDQKRYQVQEQRRDFSRDGVEPQGIIASPTLGQIQQARAAQQQTRASQTETQEDFQTQQTQYQAERQLTKLPFEQKAKARKIH